MTLRKKILREVGKITRKIERQGIIKYCEHIVERKARYHDGDDTFEYKYEVCTNKAKYYVKYGNGYTLGCGVHARNKERRIKIKEAKEIVTIEEKRLKGITL